MAAKVRFFGDDAALLGTFHLPSRLRPRGAGIVLCNPFGEEAARAHRLYRVLATQLERAGYPVLRFDFGHCGDSGGAAVDATVAGWVRDVDTAADELRHESGVPRVALVGLRLGATLAALATVRGAVVPRHLVLWDPVVDGRAYLDELAAQHDAYMRDELGERWRPPAADAPRTEALGAPLTPTLTAELAAIQLASRPPRADHITVVCTATAPTAALRALRTALPAATWLDRPSTHGWNSDAALNAAVVPIDIVGAIVERIEATIP
ncbi:MAG: alpha/beta hydrolase [Kofleriaceae bacterium]